MPLALDMKKSEDYEGNLEQNIHARVKKSVPGHERVRFLCCWQYGISSLVALVFNLTYLKC